MMLGFVQELFSPADVGDNADGARTEARLAEMAAMLPHVTAMVAAALRVEAMSLYHHLPGKEALLDGLVDGIATEIAQEIASLRAAAHWRTAIRQRCLAARTVMLRHPWAPGLIASRTVIPPSLFLHFEAMLATMIHGGFSYHLAHRALHALGSMMLGFVQELFSPADVGDNADGARTEARLAEMAAMLPHVTAMVAAEIHANDGDTLGWCDSQGEFEFTLDLILDGLDRSLDGARGRSTASTRRAPRGPRVR